MRLCFSHSLIIRCSILVSFFCNIAGHSFLQGFQVASFLVVRSSNLSRKYSIPQPFFKIHGFREHIVQYVASNNGNLARKNIVFAIPNERDDPEKEGSDYYIDYPVIVDQKEDGSSCAPEMETTFSLLQCGESIPRSNEINGKEDGLLAKLMAVHLHVLAMEQWNASKLKMSHKYVFFSFSIFLFCEGDKRYFHLYCEIIKSCLSSLFLLSQTSKGEIPADGVIIRQEIANVN